MNIADFIDKWIAKMDKFADSSGKITLSKNQVLQLRLDIYGLRKYDPFIGNETKYVSVFEASQEWWNARGVFSIESIAAKYNIKFETLNEYINAYLKLQEWIEPFKEDYTIWELYFLVHQGKPQELYFISEPHETV